MPLPIILEMKEGSQKPKILLLRSSKSSTSQGWTKLSKALNALAVCEELERSFFDPNEIAVSCEAYDHLFIDTELASWGAFSDIKMSNICLIAENSFRWTDLSIRAERIEALALHPIFVLTNQSTGDLYRGLHLYLFSKRLIGITPLFERGAIILAEKIMDETNIGIQLDRIINFLKTKTEFKLKNRFGDLRQVLTAVLLEGLRCATEKGVNYPFVDFQLGVCDTKLGINIRFPFASTDLNNLIRDILNFENYFLSQTWVFSDFFSIIHHEVENEIEISLAISDQIQNRNINFRTLLFKRSPSSSIKENLLSNPKNYKFFLISELEHQTRDSEEENDLPSLQSSLKNENQNVDTLTISKTEDAKIRSLEAEITSLKALLKNRINPKNESLPKDLLEKISTLESSVRSLESEKQSTLQAFSSEQKKSAFLEMRCAQLFKTIANKDREIIEFKGNQEKFKRDLVAENESKSLEKISESKEQNQSEQENTSKLEMEKLNLKLSKQEEHLKLIQEEARQTVKVLEKKLNESKQKEFELLKKLDSLNSLLKKSSRAG